MKANTPDADCVKSLFEGYPMKPCGFCEKEDCVCRTVKRKKIDITATLQQVQAEKRQKALKRLQQIFREEDLPLCSFK